MKGSEKKPRFNFAELKEAATSTNPKVRKKAFEEYFERFEEFPSYLFDAEHGIDDRLYQTIQDLTKDPETTKAMHKGIEILMNRLPLPPGAAGR